MDYLGLTPIQRIFLTAFGLAFVWLGILLFFDQGLMSIGNIGFIVGITMIVGHKRIMQIFTEGNIFGSICFFLGFFLVLLKGWAWLGMLIEIFGFVNLFKSFFPFVLACARYVPIIGNILSLPGIDALVSRFEQKPQEKAD